jgi:hypothetical protein
MQLCFQYLKVYIRLVIEKRGRDSGLIIKYRTRLVQKKISLKILGESFRLNVDFY